MCSFDKKSAMKKAEEYNVYLNYLRKVSNTNNFKKGVNKVVALRNLFGGFPPKPQNPKHTMGNKYMVNKINTTITTYSIIQADD